MIKNSKGNRMMNRETSKNHEKIKRPLPIRIMATLMAVVMVLSVVYINNSRSVVQADSAAVVDDSFITKGKLENAGFSIDTPNSDAVFDVYVPYNATDNNQVQFNLPSYNDIETSDESVTLYKGGTEEQPEYYLDNSDGRDEIADSKKVISYEWVNSNNETIFDINSGESVSTAYLKKITRYYVQMSDSSTWMGVSVVNGETPVTIGTLNINKEELCEINIDSSANSITAVEGDTGVKNEEVRDSSNVRYYGSVSYEVYKNDEMVGAFSTLSDFITEFSGESKPEGEYTLIKKILAGSVVLDSNSVDFEKNTMILNSVTAVFNNDEETRTYTTNLETINISGVNAKTPINISFDTDITFGTEATQGNFMYGYATAGLHVEHSMNGNTASLTITGTPSAEDSSRIIVDFYSTNTQAVNDPSKTVTINIAYGDGTPSLSNPVIAPVDTANPTVTIGTGINAKTYYSNSSVRISGNASVVEGSGAYIAKASVYKKGEANYPTEATDSTEYSKGDDTSTVNVETSLTEGENIFKLGVTSSFEDEVVDSTELKAYLDTTAPMETSVSVKQTFDSDVRNEIISSSTSEYIATNKISKSKPGYEPVIEITLSDNEGGCGLPTAAGQSAVYCGSTAVSKDDSVYKYVIPADEKDKTVFVFTLKDALGNSREISVKLSYYDETMTIENPKFHSGDNTADFILNTNNFVTWTEDAVGKINSKGYLLSYTVTSNEVPIESATISSKSGGTTVETSIPSGDIKPVSSEAPPYKYTITTPVFSGSTSHTRNDIVLTVNNINKCSETNTLTILKVDVKKPTVGTPSEKSGTGDTAESAIKVGEWYKKDLVLWFECSDESDDDESTDDPESGLNLVKKNYTDSEADGIESLTALSDGKFMVTVKESSLDDSNTPVKSLVKLKVLDNAGNETTYQQSFFVDGTKPETGLKITGVADGTYDGTLANLQNPPTISYKPSDTLSGVDSASVKATISDGVIETPLPLDEGPQPLSYYIEKGLKNTETTVYTVSVTVKDVVGNENTESKKFKVDGRPPVVTAKRSSNPTKGINYFYNSAVAVDFSATDSNISNSGLKVTVKKDDEPETAVPVPFNISGPNSEGMSTAKGSYTFDEDGVYLVSFTATDDSGRNETKTVNFEIDTKEPDVVTKLNGEDYSLSDSYNTSVTTEIVATDKNLDNNDITTTIVRELPTGGSTTETKAGVGPFGLTEDGKYTVTYKVVDKAGNPTTKTIGFTVDNSKPVHNMYITTADPAKVAKYNNTYSNAVGKFSGHSDQEEYTYGQYYNTDVSIDFSFFDYNIKSAQVTDNGSVLPVNWSFNGPYGKGSYTISSEGYHEIVISSTDKSDNTTTDSGSNQKLRFTIDKSAPTISTSLNGVRYSEGSGVRYFNTNGTIDVSVSDANIDGSDLNRINRMTVPGSSVSVSEASVGEGAETFSTEADYEVQYYAIDRAGNRSDTRTVMFRVDKTAPQLQVSNVGAVSTAGSQNVSFNVKEAFFSDMNNVTIKIYKRVEGRAEVLEKTIDFKPNSANDSTSYTFSEDAEYRIEFTAEDKCGNKSNTDYSFIKDGTAPLITLSGVSNYDKTDKNVELTVIIDEAFYSSNRVTLSGTRTDINGKSNAITFDSFVTNRSKISQLQQLFKEDGIYDITVTSTDKAGNSSSKGVHFTIDTTDPVIGDLSKYDGIRTNSFKWDTNLDELVTDLTVCDIKVYMDGSLYDGTSDVEDGSHVLKIEATDELGHTTTKEVTFVLDSRGPNIIISNVEDGDNLLDSTEVIVTVELDEDSLDTVMLNDKAVEVKDNQAKLTVNKKGKYTLSATAHDEAGNASSAEIKFTFGKQTNLLLIGIIAGILILLLLALLVVIKRRQKDQ